MTRPIAAETSVATTRDDLLEIFHALQRGQAHHRVNDDNVAALIEMAYSKGDTQLEITLREWRSPCGDPGAPPLPQQLPPAG